MEPGPLFPFVSRFGESLIQIRKSEDCRKRKGQQGQRQQENRVPIQAGLEPVRLGVENVPTYESEKETY
jgi:hypothetical protein